MKRKNKNRQKTQEKVALKDWKKHAKRLNDEGKTCFHDDHQYVSRRDFMAAGLLPFAASVTLPTVYDLLFGRVAQACEPGSSPNGNPCLFGSVTMRGGASLATNVAGRRQDGSFLSSYNITGLGTNITALSSNLSTLFGIPWDADSPIALEINRFCNEQVAAGRKDLRTLVSAIDFRSRSPDDNSTTDHLIQAMLAALPGGGAALESSHLPRIDMFAGNPGAENAFGSTPSTLQVSDISTIIGAAGGVQGAIGNNFQNPAVRGALFQRISNLSTSQMNSFLGSFVNASSVAPIVTAAAECNVEIAQLQSPVVNVLDATDNSVRATRLRQIYGINPNNSDSNDSNVIQATAIQSHAEGLCKDVACNFGGNDYHNGDVIRFQEKDTEGVRAVLRMLQVAAEENKKMVVDMNTEGACRWKESDEKWQTGSPAVAPTSDRGQNGCGFTFFMDPAGAPPIQRRDGGSVIPYQVGYYENATGQSVSQSAVAGWGLPQVKSTAVFINYLSFSLGSNWASAYQSVASSLALLPLNAAELDYLRRA